MSVEVRHILIDGDKFAGKSSLAGGLVRTNTSASLFEARGFGQSDASVLTDKMKRYVAGIANLLRTSNGPVICVRSHLFLFAMLQTMTGDEFLELDGMFETSTTSVLFVRCGHDTYRQRLQSRVSSGAANVHGIVDRPTYELRQQRYEKALELSALGSGIVDTDLLDSDCAITRAKEICGWLP